MSRKTIAKLAGFVGALGISAAMIAAASSATGAYFTDSKSGNLTGKSGVLQLDADHQSINFTGLNPGVDQSQTVNYSIHSGSTTNADIWLVFDKESAAYGAFTGNKDTAYQAGTDPDAWTTGGLGGFGHFKVRSNQGYQFESYNLALEKAEDAVGNYATNSSVGNCVVDVNGNGGLDKKATGPDNGSQAAPNCGVPAYIKLGSNLAPGTSGSAAVTFGLTGRAQTQNTNWVNVPFSIVATQPGVRPDAAQF